MIKQELAHLEFNCINEGFQIAIYCECEGIRNFKCTKALSQTMVLTSQTRRKSTVGNKSKSGGFNYPQACFLFERLLPGLALFLDGVDLSRWQGNVGDARCFLPVTWVAPILLIWDWAIVLSNASNMSYYQCLVPMDYHFRSLKCPPLKYNVQHLGGLGHMSDMQIMSYRRRRPLLCGVNLQSLDWFRCHWSAKYPITSMTTSVVLDA